ncbi:MAG: TlpA family protein disulfide reductase [Lachnospiraceae bacterium]|nr:TlpA family protein disulfide reductase [Lachnospiraceae bacterium]
MIHAKKILLAVLFVMAVLATGCGKGNAAENVNNSETIGTTETTGTAETEQETYILTFEATTTDGETLTSDCLSESKLTMINVWATYCNPCLDEMPDLGEIAASYDKAEFQMLGIVSDVMEGDSPENVEYAKELITQTNANYPHLLLNQSLYSNLVGGVEAVPTTFFVTKDGEMLGYVLGAQSKEGWEEIINGLLAEME